jgi:hypothetical protein
MSTSKNNHRPRVARMPDKVSVKSRQDRSILVQSNAPSCLIWQAHPSLKDAGEALVQAGLDLANREKKVQQLLAQAETARRELLSLRIAWDGRFTVYASCVEARARKPEDVTNLALPLREEASYELAPPRAVTARYDLEEKLLRILVKRPPGDFGCRIEISPDPVSADSFQAIPGVGARAAIPGLPPGEYWVRALMIGPTGFSAYSPLVFVRVP